MGYPTWDVCPSQSGFVYTISLETAHKSHCDGCTASHLGYRSSGMSGVLFLEHRGFCRYMSSNVSSCYLGLRPSTIMLLELYVCYLGGKQDKLEPEFPHSQSLLNLHFPTSIDTVSTNPKQKIHWAKTALGSFCGMLIGFCFVVLRFFSCKANY